MKPPLIYQTEAMTVSYTHLDVYKRQEQVILSDKESKGGYYE